MALQNMGELALLHIPEAYRAIVTGGGQQVAVGAELKTVDGGRMGLKAGDVPPAV